MLFTGASLIVLSYLLGSIPSGVIVARSAGIDLRKYGSGNTGATNVLRTMGRKASAVVFFADFLKGLIPVLAALLVTNDPLIVSLCGLAAILGHSKSIFLRFAGGRGVATAFGALLVISPWTVLAVVVVGVPLILATKYVSLGSISAAIVGPITMIVLVALGVQAAAYLLYIIPASAVIIIRHWDNIGRLLSGTEHKLGEKVEVRG